MGFDGSFQTGSTGPIGFQQAQAVPPVSPYTPAIPRYDINHYDRLIPQKDPGDPKGIPENWYKYSRHDIGTSDKKRFILSAFRAWTEWEQETKKYMKRPGLSYAQIMTMRQLIKLANV